MRSTTRNAFRSSFSAARYRFEPDGLSIPPVDIELPDGATIGSDSRDCGARLSALMKRPVSLVPLRSASDRAFYRRAIPAAAVVGALARFRFIRKLMQRATEKSLRADLGRETGEAMPDLSRLPADVFECYTPPGTYFDAFPVHVITTASLAWMARLTPSANWDVRRFRPNVLVDTG